MKTHIKTNKELQTTKQTMPQNLPYTNADIRPKPKMGDKIEHGIIQSFNAYMIHCGKCMRTSAKLLLGSIAECINGIIPRAFKYTAMSICLSIIEDDLQNNRMPLPAKRLPNQSIMLNDVIMTFDEEKIE